MAIARDTSLGIQVLSSTGGTYAYTCTGSNRLLLVWVFIQTSDAYTNHAVTVTYNSVSMTQLAHTGTTAGSDVQGVLLFGLVAPATGSNTVSVSVSGGDNLCYSMAASYTGVKQSGLPDSSGTAKANASTVSPSTTVVASNCWLFSCSYAERAQSYTAGTMTAIQGNNSQLIMGDSNTTVATGAQSVTITLSASNLVGAILISIAPYTDPNTIKSINGILWANIKNRNGITTGN